MYLEIKNIVNYWMLKYTDSQEFKEAKISVEKYQQAKNRPI